MIRTTPTPHTRFYRVTRDRLIKDLGGRCAYCGSTQRLEFDHIRGRRWSVRDTSSHTRIRRYAREVAWHQIQLLCKSCNSAKGKPEVT